jgi:hypothetical protein
VLYLIVLPLSPAKNPFAVKINNNKKKKGSKLELDKQFLVHLSFVPSFNENCGAASDIYGKAHL